MLEIGVGGRPVLVRVLYGVSFARSLCVSTHGT